MQPDERPQEFAMDEGALNEIYSCVRDYGQAAAYLIWEKAELNAIRAGKTCLTARDIRAAKRQYQGSHAG